MLFPMTTTILTITKTDNMDAAMRAIYSDPALMMWWLYRPATVRDRMERARLARRTAASPQGRFGLADVPVTVAVAIDAFLATYQEMVAPLRKYVLDARSAGASWAEVWALMPVEFDHLGFGRGDATLLDIKA
jgi:hypothetical protein